LIIQLRAELLEEDGCLLSIIYALSHESFRCWLVVGHLLVRPMHAQSER
jgi:hypothetical protein